MIKLNNTTRYKIWDYKLEQAPVSYKELKQVQNRQITNQFFKQFLAVKWHIRHNMKLLDEYD
jgi:hypothetical protein